MSLISIWWWSQGTQNVNFCQQEWKYIERKRDVKEKHDYNKKWRIIKLYFKILVVLHIQIHQVIYDRLASWIWFDKWSINKFFYVVKFKIYRFMVNIFLVLVKYTIYHIDHTTVVSEGLKRICLNHYYKIFLHVITPTGDSILIKLSSSIFQIYNHKSLFSFRQSCKTRHYTIDKCTIPSICKYLFVKCCTRFFFKN